MTDDRLSKIVARVQLATPGPWAVNAGHDRILDAAGNAVTYYANAKHGDQALRDLEFIAHARWDVQALVDEVRDLRAWKYNATQQLLDRSDQVDGLRARLRHQGLDEELSAQILAEIKTSLEAAGSDLSTTPPMYYPEALRSALARERRRSEEALATVAQLRGVLDRIRVARTEGGCSTGEAMAKSEAWSIQALKLVPADALELQRARRAVVDAAKAVHQVDVNQTDPEGAAEFSEELYAAVERLKALEDSVRART